MCDSLAVGVLGDRTAHSTGFGIGGTGTLEWLGAHEPGPVVVASLAKAYGVPLALVGGPRGVIRNIGHHEMSTIHASGPTAADRAALRGVLETDRTFLAAKRARLEQRTQQLRHLLQRHGLRPIGLPFPFVQAECDVYPVDLVRTLRRYGCHTLAITRRCGTEVDRAVLGCALRSDHSDTAIASLDRAIGRALRELRTGAVA